MAQILKVKNQLLDKSDKLDEIDFDGKTKGLVFVQGRFANKQTRDLFQRDGYTPVDHIEDADIVCWTGGEDLNPKLYNEPPAGAGHWSDWRDNDDLEAVKKAKGKFLVGICRGAQLLNVYPNGGSLWQDVDAHIGNHTLKDVPTGDFYVVNSLHHQQLRLTPEAELIAFTEIATEKYGYHAAWKLGDEPDLDVEVAWYPKTKSLCVQFHPEFSSVDGDSALYFYKLLERYYAAS